MSTAPCGVDTTAVSLSWFIWDQTGCGIDLKYHYTVSLLVSSSSWFGFQIV